MITSGNNPCFPEVIFLLTLQLQNSIINSGFLKRGIFCMMWNTCFFSAVGVLGVTVCVLIMLCASGGRKRKSVNTLHILFAALFISTLLLLLPAYYHSYSQDMLGGAKSVVSAVQKSIQVFAAKDVFDVVYSSLDKVPEGIRKAYCALSLAVQFIAPILSFGFLLSFFKNLYSHLRYILLFWKEVHVFSELNGKTVVLAESILDDFFEKQKNKKRIVRFFGTRFLTPVVVFTDVVEKKKGEQYEYAEIARTMGAVLFKKDMSFINFGFPFPKRRMKFYLISDDENEKVRHAAHIIKAYDRLNVSLYLFSDDIRSDKFLASQSIREMKAVRINDVQSLVYHDLYNHGERLFEHATEYNNNTVSVVIIGMGRYGTEVFKALSWYCQIPGYDLKINIFDMDKSTEEKLFASCPELMKMNRNTVAGEAHYDITVHSGIDVNTYEFVKRMREIGDATYVFVGLGDDGKNISVSEKARSIYAGINSAAMPIIETKIYSSDIKEQMKADNNSEINMIGDLQSFYSVDTVINSRLADMGLDVHLRYVNRSALSDEKAAAAELRKFWCNEYNFRSSVAKAMHEHLRVRLAESGLMDTIPGQDKKWEDRNAEEKLAIGKVEHVRWNAYMRSEGYVCAPKNHLAKQHHNLVSVFELSDDDLRKDA